MTADETLNELLVKLFKNIMEIEGKSLITDEFKDLTYNDFHVIEAIGMSEPKSMSTVAKLMNVTTGTLTKAMDFRTDGLVIILEDEPKYISDMLKHHPDFAEKFNSKIVIPIFTNEELLLFGKIYALNHDYCIADGAEEELYNRIREGQTDPTQPSTIQNVKKILDGVMKKVEKGGLRKIKMGFSKKRYDEEDRVLLFDKDFR